MVRYITALGTVASIIGLAFLPGIDTAFKVIICLVGVASLIYLLFDASKKNQTNQRICTSDEEIKEAMSEIIRAQGKICIMSSSLSWVDDNIKDIILKKKGRIIIFAQYKNDTTAYLESKGIKIMYYGERFSPETRFTIIGYDRNVPQVAVANPPKHSVRRNSKVHHVIYETSPDGVSQDKYINTLAKDLMSLCLVYCEEDRCAK